jgi:hypothetical protein
MRGQNRILSRVLRTQVDVDGQLAVGSNTPVYTPKTTVAGVTDTRSL